MRPVCSDEPRFLNTIFLLLNPVWQEWVMHLPTYTYIHACIPYRTVHYSTVQYRIWYDMTRHDTTGHDMTWHTYIHTCIYVCIHACIYLYTNTCISFHVYVHKYMCCSAYMTEAAYLHMYIYTVILVNPLVAQRGATGNGLGPIAATWGRKFLGKIHRWRFKGGRNRFHVFET